MIMLWVVCGDPMSVRCILAEGLLGGYREVMEV